MNPSGKISSGPVRPAAEAGVRLLSLRPKQKRLLRYALVFVLLAGASGGVYAYIATAPQRAEKQFQDAMKFMKPSHYEEAIAGFNRAVQTWPELADAYFERGNAYHALRRDDEAIADFEKATDVNPNLALAYAALGSIYRDRKDYKRAMEAYTKSINSKSTVDVYFERGQTYESLGEHQKAVDDFDRAILEMPLSPEVYRSRATARRNLGDQAGFEADSDTARRLEHRQ
jgi:tetratricopeptide (TPR) repeat protein